MNGAMGWLLRVILRLDGLGDYVGGWLTLLRSAKITFSRSDRFACQRLDGLLLEKWRQISFLTLDAPTGVRQPNYP